MASEHSFSGQCNYSVSEVFEGANRFGFVLQEGTNSLVSCVRFLLWSCHFMAWWVVDKPQSIRFHYVRLVVDIGPDSANFQLE